MTAAGYEQPAVVQPLILEVDRFRLNFNHSKLGEICQIAVPITV